MYIRRAEGLMAYWHDLEVSPSGEGAMAGRYQNRKLIKQLTHTIIKHKFVSISIIAISPRFPL